MVNKRHLVAILVATLLFITLAPDRAAAQDAVNSAAHIDQRSYDLGGTAAFAEMVEVGVKRLAFSSTLLTAEMTALLPDATRIANEHHVALYREPDLIVTDLFPADVARGKEVLLIYKGSTLDEYMDLKRQKAVLVKSSAYSGKAREQIARRLGKLLSYPEPAIDALLRKNAAARE
jgi:hypothetical protein